MNILDFLSVKKLNLRGIYTGYEIFLTVGEKPYTIIDKEKRETIFLLENDAEIVGVSKIESTDNKFVVHFEHELGKGTEVEYPFDMFKEIEVSGNYTTECQVVAFLDDSIPFLEEDDTKEQDVETIKMRVDFVDKILAEKKAYEQLIKELMAENESYYKLVKEIKMLTGVIDNDVLLEYLKKFSYPKKP